MKRREPNSLADFVEMASGQKLSPALKAVADAVDVLAESGQVQSRLVVFTGRRRVPRALTDVQRRGGKGTP